MNMHLPRDLLAALKNQAERRGLPSKTIAAGDAEPQ
jgi:hypothetical protein